MINRRAYTLMELMVVVMVAAIIFVTCLPDGDSKAQEQGQSFADRFQGDLSYARSLSISDPSDPAIIKISPGQNKYWVAKKSTPDTAVTHPVTKRPYVVSSNPRDDADGVMILASGFGGDEAIGFDSTGALDQDTPATLRIKAGKMTYDIEINPVASKSELKESVDSNLADDGSGKLASVK